LREDVRDDREGTAMTPSSSARVGLRVAIAVVALLLVVAVATWLSARRAYARAEAFCAGSPAGTPARDATIRALDQGVQVRTDIEPGSLVVRFEAWGPSRAVGECRMGLDGDHVATTRVVRR
jgi:hypothetical protein